LFKRISFLPFNLNWWYQFLNRWYQFSELQISRISEKLVFFVSRLSILISFSETPSIKFKYPSVFRFLLFFHKFRYAIFLFPHFSYFQLWFWFFDRNLFSSSTKSNVRLVMRKLFFFVWFAGFYFIFFSIFYHRKLCCYSAFYVNYNSSGVRCVIL